MSDARILDRGYRRYDGDRRGVRGAVRSVVTESTRRMLGLKRSVGHKVLPVLTGFIAYVPAIAFVGFALLVPDEFRENPDDLTYAGYYGVITIAILLFVALVGPEALCADRRTGMLGLYFASPLTRDTYLLSKAAALSLVLAVVTLGPPLLLLVGYTAVGQGPDGVLGFALLLAQIVAAAVVVSLLYTTLTLAVSATTDRRAVASAAIIFVLLGSAVVTETLVAAADASPYFLLLNLFRLPFDLVVIVYGETNEDPNTVGIATWATVAAYGCWVVLLAGFSRLRYQRLDVTR